jgi:hypothetical protein
MIPASIRIGESEHADGVFTMSRIAVPFARSIDPSC